jgi:hypothetical protein
MLSRGDNFSPRMPCQWYVRGGREGKRRILIGQSVPPTPFGMAVGRLKLSPQKILLQRVNQHEAPFQKIHEKHALQKIQLLGES